MTTTMQPAEANGVLRELARGLDATRRVPLSIAVRAGASGRDVVAEAWAASNDLAPAYLLLHLPDRRLLLRGLCAVARVAKGHAKGLGPEYERALVGLERGDDLDDDLVELVWNERATYCTPDRDAAIAVTYLALAPLAPRNNARAIDLECCTNTVLDATAAMLDVVEGVARRGTHARMDARAEQLGRLVRTGVPVLTLREVMDACEVGRLVAMVSS